VSVASAEPGVESGAEAATGPHDRRPLSGGERAIILAGGPAISLATSLIQAVLPSIEADLARGPDDAFLVKMLVGAAGFAMVFGAALTGFLVDRLGLGRVMAANYALYALAGTAGVYLTDLRLLVASRFLLGLAAAGAVTGSIIIINARLDPARRAMWLGYYNAVAQFSSVLLNPVSGFLGEFSWHWSFAIYGIAAPFALIAAASLGGEEPRAPARGRGPVEPLWRWFPARFAGVAVLLGIVTYVPAVYLPFLLRDLGMTSPQSISLVLTGDIIAGSLAALFYGRARRRLSLGQAFAISVTLAGLGLLVAALANSVVLVVVGSVVFGLGVAWFLPNLMFMTAARVTAEQQGRAAGLVKGANYLGSPTAVFLTEPIARSHGAPGAVIAAGLLSLVLVLAALPGVLARRSGPAQ